ncbi:MAG: flagellar hook-associated protein FlgK [Planctomycetota bacterium]|nr:MAG: flagellar hook-associated protein FlgK [Planctomycetota bacterium]
MWVPRDYCRTLGGWVKWHALCVYKAMSNTLFNALSALQTHQRAMTVTSHNIANATTPGYTRQRAILATNVPQAVKPGQVGRGVQVAEINRIADNFITERLRSVQSESGRLNEMRKVLADLELTFNEPSSSGFANSINRFFAAFEDLSNNPESNATRSGTIEQLRTFTSSINDIANSLEGQRESTAFGADQVIQDINRLTGQLSQLNQDIRRATAAQTNPNDLLDTRDRLLKELSGLAQVKVRYQGDQSVLVELDGRLLVGAADSTQLATERGAAGDLTIIFKDDGRAINLDGGRLQALQEVNNSVLPGIIKDFDQLAVAMMQQMNTIHATGANHTARPAGHLGTRIIAPDQLNANLDSLSQLLPKHSKAGIPEGLQPSFVDAAGNPTATNLTINVLNTTTGVAEKYTLRYEPGSLPTPASRSLQDLVNAINTGKGGGFSVHPPTAGGIPNLQAKALPVDGGFRFSLGATDGHSVDFSRSLDLEPAARAWTGEDITGIDGSDATLANQRLGLRVNAGSLEAFTIDPVTGNEVPYASTAISPGPATLGNLSLNFAGDAVDYVDGQSFAIDFNAAGAVVDGPRDIRSTWTEGSANVGIFGRYSGEVGMIPDQPWSMEVIQGGLVGAPLGANPPNNPPMVKFTYNVGDGSGSAQQETVVITLDENFPPGSQVAIADGVYATFGAGTLSESTANDVNRLDFTVDGQPDEAGLLAALGVGGLFEGTKALDMQVSAALRNSPTNLLVGHTRAAGDNANVLGLLDSRGSKLLDNNTVTFEEFYQGRVSGIAVRVNQAEQLQRNQADLQASLENRRDEISGVSIDEEVGFLILQQQAYQAAARLISIERDNIQTLIGILS